MHEVLELLLLWCCWVILSLQNLSATLITLSDLFGGSSLLKIVSELREEFGLAVCDRQLSLRFAVCFASVNMGKGGVAATFCEILIAILLPPLGVFLKYACGIEFWICLLLTILGYIPGILYALYVIVM